MNEAERTAATVERFTALATEISSDKFREWEDKVRDLLGEGLEKFSLAAVIQTINTATGAAYITEFVARSEDLASRD